MRLRLERRPEPWNAVIAALPAIALVLAATASATPPPPDSVKTCIRAWPQVVYGAMGYNHVVHIANGCAPTADCSVTTNVNPEPIDVSVPGHDQVAITTWRGSPAREFTPYVNCKMRN